MVCYKVGQVVDQFKNHEEGIYFDVRDCGAELRVFFDSPTKTEEEQFISDKKFEIRFVELNGVIMLVIKIGNLEWMDAPYTPHLSINLTKLDILHEGQGLALTLMLIDARTGEIKHMRLLSLPEKFSRKLFIAIMEQMGKKFDVTEYAKALEKIYSVYSVKQIAKMGNAYR